MQQKYFNWFIVTHSKYLENMLIIFDISSWTFDCRTSLIFNLSWESGFVTADWIEHHSDELKISIKRKIRLKYLISVCELFLWGSWWNWIISASVNRRFLNWGISHWIIPNLKRRKSFSLNWRSWYTFRVLHKTNSNVSNCHVQIGQNK